jgi:hypothetical protein
MYLVNHAVGRNTLALKQLFLYAHALKQGFEVRQKFQKLSKEKLHYTTACIPVG